MTWKDYEIEKAEAEYERAQEAERIERERLEEEEACRLADAEETGCTVEEVSAPLPLIERKPVRMVYTAQGNLFEEVA